MALTIVNNYPLANETEVVLKASIDIEFSEAVATGTITETTFVVYSEGDTLFKEAGGALGVNPTVYGDRDYIDGTYSFSVDKKTVSFIPTSPFSPNTVYTVILAGYDLVSTNIDYIRSETLTERLESTTTWSFTTGQLSLTAPPKVSEPIDFDDLIEELIEETETPSGQLIVSPDNGSFNVALVDDVLFTFTTPSGIDESSISYRVYLTDLADPLKTKIEIPSTYEVSNGRVLKIKFA